MTENLRLLHDLPGLRRPTFIAAFRGWNDAGESATVALRYLIEEWGAEPFAEIDPEEFADFTVNRPTIRVTEEGLRDLEWPADRFYYHRRPNADSDVVLLLASEPHLRWRTYAETLRGLFDRLEASRLVTLGGLVAATIHRQPPPVTGFATEEELQAKLRTLSISRSRYEGPTGIVGTLHDAWARDGLAGASIWVATPAYLGSTVNPTAALALLETLDRLLDLRPDTSRLGQASRAFLEQVEQALAENEEMRGYLAQLEQRLAVEGEESEAPELPTTGEILGDLEEFLRRQREDE